MADRLRQHLSAHGQPVALVARAGTRLARFGVRYTHAALALADNPLGPWAVRQLYFACDEAQIRLFDQGLAGFLAGADRAEQGGFVSLLLLPAEAAAPLAAAALHTEGAQALLAGRYLATAHPQDLLRLNCNQWLAELMAQAWTAGVSSRAQAQAVLADWQYQVQPVVFGNPLWRLPLALLPWIGVAGQRDEDLNQQQLRTSLPPDLERLALQRWPGARRLALCYTREHLLLREQGPPLAELPADCQPAEGEAVQRF